MENVGTSTGEKQNGLIQMALKAKHADDHSLAFDLYNQAIKMGDHGYLAQAYYNKGVLWLDQHQHRDALNCFQEAVSLDPDYEKAWVNLGSVYLFFDQYKEALYAFERAHGLVPDQVHSLFNRGYALNRLGRYREASNILKNLIVREEKFKDVIGVMGEEAYRLYSEAALSSLQLGDHQNALHYFRKAFNLNTGDYQVCYNLAFIYDHVKDFEQAILFYDLSIALDPNQHKGYQGKACTYIHMKKYNDALQWIARSINLSPENFEAYYNLACIYAGQGEQENMINAIAKTIELAPRGLDIKAIFRNDADFAAFTNDAAFLQVTC